MTYQEKLEELQKTFQEKLVVFSRVNKEVLEMTGFNIPKIDRNSKEAVELKEASDNYSNFLALIEKEKINLSDEM